MHELKIIEKGESLDKAKGALILLHGRGASAFDIMPLSNEIVDKSFYVVAPEATNHSWYPYSFMADEKKNEPWLSSAVDIVQNVIQEIAKVIPKDRIFVMGFSQGACLALESTARHAESLGGVASFTGGLIGETLDLSKYRGDFAGTPIFIGNSDNDPHVPLERSLESKKILDALGAKVVLKVYPGMPHTINEDEIITVKETLLL